jgi:SAM-dependent methyltransferase
VADLGAGTGYFLPYLSRAVGPQGRVLALDTEDAMVEHMRARVEREGLDNVEVRRVAPDDPALPERGVHRVLIVNTWHHIADREVYARRLHQALSSGSTDGGAVVIVDFDRDSPHGPPPEMRIPAATVMDELRAAGLHPHLREETLPYQYIVVAWRAPPARSSSP